MQVARRLLVTMLLAVLAGFLAPAPAPAAPSAGPVKFYVVRSEYAGQPEFLFEIAQRFLGSGDRNPEIFKLNKGRLQPDGLAMTKPEAILPGWVLQLPGDAKGDGVETGQLPKYAPTPSARPQPQPKQAASTGTGQDGPGALAWTLLIAGAVVLIAVVGVGVWLWRRDELPPLPRLRRRRPPPPPPFLSARPAPVDPADSDRFYVADEQLPTPQPSFAAAAERDRVPAVALAGAAVVAVAALVAGVVLAVTGGADSSSAASPLAQDSLGPRIGSSDPSLCLAATTAGDGAPLILRSCDGSRTQQWQVASDGTIRTAGRCMDVAGAAKKTGTIVQLATCNGNPAQQFAFDGAKLVSKLTGNCVDVSGAEVTAGAGAVIEECATAGTRAWRQLP